MFYYFFLQTNERSDLANYALVIILFYFILLSQMKEVI